MTNTNEKQTNNTSDDFFKGCVLHERAKRGEYPKYEYKGNSIPETTVDSAPGWSLFIDEPLDSEK